MHKAFEQSAKATKGVDLARRQSRRVGERFDQGGFAQRDELLARERLRRRLVWYRRHG
jgi:hypothetical protein